MEELIIDIFVKYFMLPLVAMVLSALCLFFAYRGKLLNKKVVIYLSTTTLGLSLLGLLGVMDVYFMPYTFVIVQFVFLIAGLINYFLLHKWLTVLENSLGKYLLLLLPQIMLVWAFFSVLFNLTNSFQYGVYSGSASLTLAVVPFFMSAYCAYLQIPMEVYKLREYSADGNYLIPYQTLGSDDLLVCEIELYRHPSDKETIRIKAKAKTTMLVGDWFGLIVSDYNLQAVDRPVEFNDKQQNYGWMFYTKPSFFKARRYIDPDTSFMDNGLKEKNLIVAKRVENRKENR